MTQKAFPPSEYLNSHVIIDFKLTYAHCLILDGDFTGDSTEFVPLHLIRANDMLSVDMHAFEATYPTSQP